MPLNPPNILTNSDDTITYQLCHTYQDLPSFKSTLTFFYANVRSIKRQGKFDELQCIIASIKFTTHVIILTETWFKSSEDADHFQLPNYTHYYSVRTDSRGGGVSIYVHNTLNHSLVDEVYAGGINYLWVRLEKHAVNIGAVYNPGNNNTREFLEVYSSQLIRKPRSIVFGDFNIDLLTKNSKTKYYRDAMKESGYGFLNNIHEDYSTRETASTKTILDHVCTNLKDKSFHMVIIDSPMSDHKQIYLSIKKYKKLPKQRVKYEAIDYDKLHESIALAEYSPIDNTYENFEKYLKYGIHSSTTVKTKILNPPRQDWICKEITGKIRRRNEIWHRLKQEPNNEDLMESFRIERNITAETIRSTKKKYYYEAFMKYTADPKKMWNLINTLSNNKIKSQCIPPKLLTESGPLTNGNEVCETFNRFFSTIGSALAKLISTQLQQHKTVTVPDSQTYNREFTSFTPCQASEVSKIIKNLDPNCSAGIDGITTKVVKCVTNLIVNKLTDCINVHLASGTFPDQLKVAKVTPIHKSGVKTDPNNYRPISVLPIMSKIFERVLYTRLDEHLTSINFLFERQYGFRIQSNTLSATVDLVTKIQSNIDQKNMALGLFIDLKKAFDTVSHPILLQKLKDIGVSGVAYKMFESYLNNRLQIVKIGEYQSKPHNITFGVPQGSLLGPLFFLIYINSIHKVPIHGHISLYADDTCLFYFGGSITDMINQAQEDLNTLSIWFQQNLLTINASKTSYVIFKAKNKKIPPHPPLTIENQILELKQHEKYLGLRLDCQLNWKVQIDYVRSKMTSLLGSLRNIVHCLPYSVRQTIYNSLLKPHILYLIEIWGNAPKTNLKDLQIAQNKIIKMLFHYNYLTPTIKIYKDTKLLNIKQLHAYCTCILIQKILNKTIHTQISFTKTHQLHNRSSRRKDHIVLPRVRTTQGKRSLVYEGVQMYNKLPDEIKGAISINIFKNKLKKYVLENISTN